MKHYEDDRSTLMCGVAEYTEGRGVYLVRTAGEFAGVGMPRIGAGRLAVSATNEGGHNNTEVDLLQLLEWVKANRPELLAPSTASAAA